MSAWDSGDPIEWASRRLACCGVESARMEAQLLLALTLDTTRTTVIAGLYEPLRNPDRVRFEEFVEARCRRTPLAYLRGTQEFYGLEFEVSPAVLIPRPETEMLVDFARERVKAVAAGATPASLCHSATIADVGTGSGCIAIACLTHCLRAHGMAVDISPRALKIARRNANRHGVSERLLFIQGDLLLGAAADTFNLILSNPPYISTGDLESLQPEVRDSEPLLALDGGPDGLAPYRRLAPWAMHCLLPGGWIAVEVGQGQAGTVERLFAEAGLREIEVRKDLAGIERVVTARRFR
jgi:release factor glutamine methyltransferase